MFDGRLRRQPPTDQETFRDLLEAAPDAMVIADGDGHIVLVNSQTERLFGYPREELLGRPVELLLPESLRGRHAGHRQRFSQEPRVRPMGQGLDLRGRRKDGSEFPVEISLSPIEFQEGRFVTSAIRDITDRKRIENELREKNLALEQASRTKDQFLANMSHELRTPLNAVIGFTGTLLMGLPGPLTPDQDRQLRTIQTSARHLLSLINDLLDIARITAGKAELRHETLAVGAVVGEVVESLRPQADEKHLALHLELPDGEVELRSDRRALRQIVLNLAANAVRYTDAGEVRVVVSRGPAPRGGVDIAIIDTGPGIAETDRARLFEAFSQLGGEANRSGGTGLGLHLSAHLAAQLGGHIDVDSRAGEGSRFTLVLPG